MTQNCRHCGRPVEPFPGKPGYVDECLQCLYEKAAPRRNRQDAIDEEIVSKLAKQFSKVRRRAGLQDIGEDKELLVARAVLSFGRRTMEQVRAEIKRILEAQ